MRQTLHLGRLATALSGCSRQFSRCRHATALQTRLPPGRWLVGKQCTGTQYPDSPWWPAAGRRVPAPKTPPDWLLKPIRLAPVAFDSPEYSVLPANSTGVVTLKRPDPTVPIATAGHSPISNAKNTNEHTPPVAEVSATSATPVTLRSQNPCGVAAQHLSPRRYYQRQGHEPPH